MLETKLCGISLKSPLILASGILGVSYSTMERAFKAGLGAVTTKSIGKRVRIGYNNPSIIEVFPETFINSVGLGNPGINNFTHEIEILRDLQIPTIVSVFGKTNQEYIEVAQKAENSGANAIEINISCPHAKVSSIGASEKLTFDLVSELNKKISIPLFVKLNPNVTDIVKIGKAAEEGGADALVAINTIAAMVIDVNTRRPILSHGSGGLSGKAIHPIAIKKVYDLYKNVKIPIIGCGGIKSWRDAVEFFLAGARSVQIGTAFYQGFDFVESINIGIINYLTQNNFNSLSEIIGLTHKFNIQEVPKYDE